MNVNLIGLTRTAFDEHIFRVWYLRKFLLDASEHFRGGPHLGLLSICSLGCQILGPNGSFISQALLFCCLASSFFGGCSCSLLCCRLSSFDPFLFGTATLLLFRCRSLAVQEVDSPEVPHKGSCSKMRLFFASTISCLPWRN